MVAKSIHRSEAMVETTTFVCVCRGIESFHFFGGEGGGAGFRPSVARDPGVRGLYAFFGKIVLVVHRRFGLFGGHYLKWDGPQKRD